jgi:hypothetical protein
MNKNSIISSSLIYIPLISFSLHIALANISRVILNNSGERGHPCFLIYLIRKLQLFIFKYSVSYRLFVGVLHQVGKAILSSWFNTGF